MSPHPLEKASPTRAEWGCGSPRKAVTTWLDVLIMIRRLVRRTLTLLLLVVLALGVLRTKTGLRLPRSARWATSRTVPTRPAGTKVLVDPATVWVDDGDTIRITWPDAPRETVRILGIDAPEIGHGSDPTAGDQPYGRESLEFARRHLLGAGRLELLRAAHHDRFLRTLGYLFVDGVNYSTLAVENHMAECTIERFGDSGFPREAAEVRDAERRAGPPPFESPARFRERATPDPRAPRILR